MQLSQAWACVWAETWLFAVVHTLSVLHFSSTENVHVFRTEGCGLSCRSAFAKQWNMLIWVKLKINVSPQKL